MRLGTNQNGILEIFYVGGSSLLYHNRQSAPNSDSWTGETCSQMPTGRRSRGIKADNCRSSISPKVARMSQTTSTQPGNNPPTAQSGKKAVELRLPTVALSKSYLRRSLSR